MSEKKNSQTIIYGEQCGHILWTQEELDTPIPAEDRAFGGPYLAYEPDGPNTPPIHDLMTDCMYVDIRRFAVRRAGMKCEVCGRSDFLRLLDRWEYQFETKVRKLRRLMCLCKQCHISSLRNLDRPLSPIDQRDTRMRQRCGMTEAEFRDNFEAKKVLFETISQIEWKSDLSILSHLALLHPGPTKASRHTPFKNMVFAKPPANRQAVRFDSTSNESEYKIVLNQTVMDTRLAEAKAMWACPDKYSVPEIAAKVGLHEVTLYKRFGRRTDLPAPPPDIVPDDKIRDAVKRIRDGENYDAVLAELGVTALLFYRLQCKVKIPISVDEAVLWQEAREMWPFTEKYRLDFISVKTGIRIDRLRRRFGKRVDAKIAYILETIPHDKIRDALNRPKAANKSSLDSTELGLTTDQLQRLKIIFEGRGGPVPTNKKADKV
jgi:hypothetical protein